uniref:Uncharacterized protein n=1 Tax=Pararge aegeria TaxID=116150 RepID=S4PKI6_9NEOP
MTLYSRSFTIYIQDFPIPTFLKLEHGQKLNVKSSNKTYTCVLCHNVRRHVISVKKKMFLKKLSLFYLTRNYQLVLCENN